MTSSRVPLVSVVTPVYNGEEYLAECIESVLRQSYDTWRYTIVNNCSTDRSLEIAQAYAAQDSRIEVESNETFLGQVPNLNKAMSLISPDSKYCKMVLADDWMFANCLAEMVHVAERHPSVGIVSSYRLDDQRVNCDGLSYPSPVVNGKDICRASLLEDLFVFGSPSTILFRSDLVRARIPFYDETSLHEDTEACYEILADHDLGFVHQVLTFTRRQNESLTAARRTIDPQHRLDNMIVTLKYGPRFLNETEYASCLKRVEKAYYQFLAESSMYRTAPGFWSYHHEGLETVGYTLKKGTFIAYWLRAGLRQLGNPFRLAGRFRRLLGGSSERPAGSRPGTGDSG